MYNIRKGAHAMPGPVRRTCACGLVYELVYKRVKNVNFRVRADGTLAVSCDTAEYWGLDTFVVYSADRTECLCWIITP